MGQSSSWYFEQLFHGRTSPDAKLVLIEKLFYSSIPSLEFLILSDGDRHNSSIARIGTPWWVGIRMVTRLLFSKTFNHQATRPQFCYILHLSGTTMIVFFYCEW
jgi:hypothetical protein